MYTDTMIWALAYAVAVAGVLFIEASLPTGWLTVVVLVLLVLPVAIPALDWLADRRARES